MEIVQLFGGDTGEHYGFSTWDPISYITFNLSGDNLTEFHVLSMIGIICLERMGKKESIFMSKELKDGSADAERIYSLGFIMTSLSF